jgi:hypothetical protein
VKAKEVEDKRESEGRLKGRREKISRRGGK